MVESSNFARHTVSARFSKQCSGDEFRYAFAPSKPMINVKNVSIRPQILFRTFLIQKLIN